MASNGTLLNWMKASSWLSIVLGIVIFAAPLFTGDTATTYANAMVAGLLVFVLAVVEERSEATGRTGRVLGTSIVNALAGFWLIGYPYVVSTTRAFMATSLTVGVLLVVAEVFNLIAASSLRSHTMAS
jgi:uncharacterized membrane protein HdeD (DUF308 family)